MALDTRYLEKHGAQWRVQVKVPVHLRKEIGKAKLVKGLGTDNLARANRLRWAVINEFKKLLDEAEKRSKGLNDPVMQEALELRRDIEVAKDDPLVFADVDPDGEVVADSITVLSGLISDRASELSAVEGGEVASAFYGVAMGKHTPIEMMLDTWLGEKDMKPRQKVDYRRAVMKFVDFVSAAGKKPTVEGTTKRRAGEYVSSLVAAKVHPKTLNKDVSALSSYWRWLIKKGYVEQNVWQGQSVPKAKTSKNELKRPFTDE